MDANLGYALITAIGYFFRLINILIFIRVILSWVPMNSRSNPLLAVVYTLTDPILNPIRRLLQQSPLGGRGMMLDFSPLFALVLLGLAETVIKSVVLMFF